MFCSSLCPAKLLVATFQRSFRILQILTLLSMANNAARQGGNANMNEHVEFTVKVSFRTESSLVHTGAAG